MINHAETSLLRIAFPSNATAQQPPIKRATGGATGAQQPPAKPASLLDIARNKLRNMHATSAENTVQQAPQITSEAVALITTSWRWLLHYHDHDVEVSTTPESTLAEVLRDFPTAISAEPIPDTPKRKATEAETKELTALVNLIYASDTEADRAEALAAALADPDDALTCYRAIRNTLRTRLEPSQIPSNTQASPNSNGSRIAHPARRAA